MIMFDGRCQNIVLSMGYGVLILKGDGFDILINILINIWKMRKIEMISICSTKVVVKSFTEMKKAKEGADLVVVWIKNSIKYFGRVKFEIPVSN